MIRVTKTKEYNTLRREWGLDTGDIDLDKLFDEFDPLNKPDPVVQIIATCPFRDFDCEYELCEDLGDDRVEADEIARFVILALAGHMIVEHREEKEDNLD